MNTAKHSKDWNSQPSQKKPFPYGINQHSNLVISILVGSILGTYLDLYFIGKGLYSFPIRPMSSVFPINIAFTLVGLPLLTGFFLYVCSQINNWSKVGLIILFSLFMLFVEKQAETLGFFTHHESWSHLYSFFGYFIYLTCIDLLYRWLNKNKAAHK